MGGENREAGIGQNRCNRMLMRFGSIRPDTRSRINAVSQLSVLHCANQRFDSGDDGLEQGTATLHARIARNAPHLAHQIPLAALPGTDQYANKLPSSS